MSDGRLRRRELGDKETGDEQWASDREIGRKPKRRAWGRPISNQFRRRRQDPIDDALLLVFSLRDSKLIDGASSLVHFVRSAELVSTVLKDQISQIGWTVWH